MQKGERESRTLVYVGWDHEPFRKSNLIKCESLTDGCGEFKQSKLSEAYDEILVRSKEGQWVRFYRCRGYDPPRKCSDAYILGGEVLSKRDVRRRFGGSYSLFRDSFIWEYKYIPDQQHIVGQVQTIVYHSKPEITSKRPVKLIIKQALWPCTPKPTF